MRSGSVISPMTRNCPPHSGQSVISTSNTRFNRWAQVSGAVGGSLQSLRNFVDEHGRVGGAAAESSSFLRRRARAGVGTIARRIGELGAKTVVISRALEIRLM